MKGNKINNSLSINNKEKDVKQEKPNFLEARNKQKLKMLMNTHTEGKNDFVELNHTDEYIIYDKQDYNDLDQWKKDLVLKENDDVSDKLKKRFHHIQTLKEDVVMPELNYEIIDSVMNPKYDEEESRDVEQIDNIPTSQLIKKESEENEDGGFTRQPVLLNPDFNASQFHHTRSSFFKGSTTASPINTNQKLNNEKFSDFIVEPNTTTHTNNPNHKKTVSLFLPSDNSKDQNGRQHTQPQKYPPDQKQYPLSRIHNQSTVYLHRNLNKQILNNLLLTRITKKYHSEYEAKCEDQDVDENKKKKVRIDPSLTGQSFYNQGTKQKNKSLDIVRHLFSEETDKFSKTTLNSFKNVGNQFFRLGNVIEYDTLLKEIINAIYHPQGILDTKNIDGIKKGMEFDEESFTYLEKALLENYQSTTKKIEELQDKIREERLYQTSISLELKTVHEEMMEQLSKIDLEEESFKNDISLASNMQLYTHSKSTKINVNRFKNIQTVDFKMKHQKIEEKRQEVQIYFESLKKVISQRIKASIEKLELMDKEILKIKQKRNTTKTILKDLYVKSLKCDMHSQKQSLVQVIKSLLSVNDDLMNTNFFPSIIDDQSKQFLIQWAKLLIQQDQIQEKIKRIGTDNLNVTEQYQNVVLESSKISSTHSREAIKQKVHRLSRGSVIWRKSIDASSSSSGQNFFPRYDEITEPSYSKAQERIAFDLNKFSQECIQTVETKNNLRQETIHINNLIEQLKNAEKERLFKKVKPNGPGYHQKIQQLHQTLLTLFGKQEGNSSLGAHLKEVSNFDEKIKNQKFFTFSTKKPSDLQNSIIASTSKTEGALNSSKTSFRSPQVASPQTTVSSGNKKQNKQNNEEINLGLNNELPPQTSEGKLTLASNVISTFNEKKKQIIENHQIMIQYNQLNSIFFKEKLKSIQKVSNSNNANSHSEQNQPLLQKYFFNVKQRRSSDQNIISTTSTLKSPQYGSGNTQNIAQNSMLKSFTKNPYNHM